MIFNLQFRLFSFLAILLFLVCWTATFSTAALNITAQLDYTMMQYRRLVTRWIDHQKDYPHIGPPATDWEYESGATPFTGGFFTSTLWELYGYTNDSYWRDYADLSQINVAPAANRTNTHDVGFTIYWTFGLGFELTGNNSYLPVLKQASESLSTRYSAKVGCTRSWDENNRPKSDFWVIIDNMMNLQLLWWTSLQLNNKTWFDMAHTHASRTMIEHFRVDNSTYHVVEYNETTGDVISKHTSQGYADYSMWARGQAWGIYGFVMSYRYSGYVPFLDKAIGAADIFLARLQKEVDDYVPYWDFDAPFNTSYQPRDSSASSIVASALLEISFYGYPAYKDHAITLLTALSSKEYFIPLNPQYKIAALLSNGTSNWPNHSGLDYALIFGDYYYVEALVRLSQMMNGIETDFMRQYKYSEKMRNSPEWQKQNSNINQE